MSDTLASTRPAPCLASDECAARAAEEAFAEFYRTVLPRVYAFIRSQVGRPDVAEDVVGRIFLKVYSHRASIPPGREGQLWVFRVAHRTLIDYYRVEGRRARGSVPLGEAAEPASPDADPEGLCLRRERQAQLVRAIGNLRKRDRILVGLRFAGQRTNREIAALLGISEAAVSMRLLRALERLRRRILEHPL